MNNVKVNQPYVGYYEYDSPLSCVQAQEQYKGLTPEQQIAQTKATQPVSVTGWRERNCVGSFGDGPWVPDNDNGPSYFPGT